MRPRPLKRVKPRKRRGPLPLRYVFLFSFLIFTFLTVIGFWLVEQSIRPTLISIASNETKLIATSVINDAVSRNIVDQLDQDELFIEKGDNQVQFNTQIYNRLVSEATVRVQNHLKAIEQGHVTDLNLHSILNDQDVKITDGGIMYTIPLGQATNNALLAHFGPHVPVRFSTIGEISTDLNLEVIDTGINNTTLAVSFDVMVDVQIVIPFATATEAYETTVPIGILNIQGEVPEIYSEGGGMVLPAVPPSSETGEEESE
ncbi:sporulation protein YunB [Halalkalibacterium halodurans]|uniref:sporulation protein YunB n=1 Tax=Halalkalibacterium halodurans TaxID=86665 RepID=UPI002AA9767B|nr:sporulation protein YunB [Halalkalibacterium halodurans]MDY7221572.1 sporulation protein YunB [Halalkalibacterium halodurans]MDY7240848.1 sporulation protein YunB [Halalkalibacterium halodurans]